MQCAVGLPPLYMVLTLGAMRSACWLGASRQNVGKKTPEGHPDRTLLAEAAQRMKDTVGDINDTIKQHESRVRARCHVCAACPAPTLTRAAPTRRVACGRPRCSTLRTASCLRNACSWPHTATL